MAADVAFDGFVGQQLGQVALGHNQVEQVGAVVGFCFLVPLLHLAHLFSRSAGLKSARCSGGVALSRASACATVMVLLAIIISIASTWRAAFMLRRMRVTPVIQALIPEAPVEALDERVLRGFPSLDQLELNIVLAGPLVEGFTGKFRPLIGSNGLRVRP